MKILSEPISKQDLLNAEVLFDGPMVKAVADIKTEKLAVDAELHADLERFLLDSNSNQDDLWGFNLWPEDEDDFIEYDSMINIRPRQGNRSRTVENPEIQAKIREIVARWIQ